MIKKIIWGTIEFLTFAVGTLVFVQFAIDKDGEGAGIGALLIILGFLINSWKLDVFIKKSGRFSTLKKFIQVIVEFSTIAVGTLVFVQFAIENDGDIAGNGAFFIVLGLMIKSWIKNNSEDKDQIVKLDKNKLFNTGIIMVVVFTMLVANFNSSDSSDSSDTEYYDFDTLENRVEQLENNTHYHNSDY